MEQHEDDVIVAAPPPPQSVESIEHPAKLLRIASMVRELLGEIRQSSLDEPGRTRLRSIYNRSLTELNDVLSEDLQRELGALAVPLDRMPSDSEIRVSQAQLAGWLDGLFHGIQAAVYAQQMEARGQLEGGSIGPSPGGARRSLPPELARSFDPSHRETPTGQYL